MPGATYFVTWRLHGSLAKNQIAKTWTADGFIAHEELLDAAQTGPKWLSEPEVAEAVIKILLQGEERKQYELGAWVLMPNHVHILIRPEGDLPKAIAAIKALSARAVKKTPFWAKDYFDRLIRDRHEEHRATLYIQNNPTKAGLTNWPFSSLTTTSKDPHQ
ncbi:MAG: REP-associated tyrosine transposase [Bryobacterales bacterium]|jgi:REP element-mobilizing transposase RayT|nr:REP-associated tyrosine transposase [Bryobacterales bacterium]